MTVNPRIAALCTCGHAPHRTECNTAHPLDLDVPTVFVAGIRRWVIEYLIGQASIAEVLKIPHSLVRSTAVLRLNVPDGRIIRYVPLGQHPSRSMRGYRGPARLAMLEPSGLSWQREREAEQLLRRLNRIAGEPR